MKLALCLTVLLAACALPAAAWAGAPPVRSTAYIIEDARTGEVLDSSNAHAHRPIASLTKLMTVLLTLQHHKLTDVVTVDPRAAAVGESSIDLAGGEQMTVSDLLKGTLIQSANDAADALALSMAPDYPSFARLMNAEAAKLGLRDTHFVRPDGLDAPDEYSSAADITALARLVMHTRFVRETVRQETATISGGRTLHTWDDLLSQFRQTIGVKTGHTDLAGWCQVAAARGRGVTIYATLLGSPTRSERNVDLQSLLIWGLAQFRLVPAVASAHTYADVRVPYGQAPLALVAAKPLLDRRASGPAADRDRRRAGRRLAARPPGRGARTHRDPSGARSWSEPRDLVASRSINKPGLGGRLGWYAGRTLHHLAHLF